MTYRFYYSEGTLLKFHTDMLITLGYAYFIFIKVFFRCICLSVVCLQTENRNIF